MNKKQEIGAIDEALQQKTVEILKNTLEELEKIGINQVIFGGIDPNNPYFSPIVVQVGNEGILCTLLQAILNRWGDSVVDRHTKSQEQKLRAKNIADQKLGNTDINRQNPQEDPNEVLLDPSKIGDQNLPPDETLDPEDAILVYTDEHLIALGASEAIREHFSKLRGQEMVPRVLEVKKLIKAEKEREQKLADLSTTPTPPQGGKLNSQLKQKSETNSPIILP